MNSNEKIIAFFGVCIRIYCNVCDFQHGIKAQCRTYGVFYSKHQAYVLDKNYYFFCDRFGCKRNYGNDNKKETEYQIITHYEFLIPD